MLDIYRYLYNLQRGSLIQGNKLEFDKKKIAGEIHLMV